MTSGRRRIRSLTGRTLRDLHRQNLELGDSHSTSCGLGHSSLTMSNYYATLADENRMRRHCQFSYMSAIRVMEDRYPS